jgi:hypothetical protein
LWANRWREEQERVEASAVGVERRSVVRNCTPVMWERGCSLPDLFVFFNELWHYIMSRRKAVTSASTWKADDVRRTYRAVQLRELRRNAT